MDEETNFMKIKYSETDEKNEKRAIIATFPSHIPISNFDKMEFSYTKDGSAKSIIKSRQRKLECVSSETKVTYTGQLYGEETFSGFNSYKQYIGVFNRKKNKLQLIDANSIEMNFLHEEEELKKTKDSEETKNKIRDRLIKAFGSTKGKRLIDSRERNSVIQESFESSMGAAINITNVDGGGTVNGDADGGGEGRDSTSTSSIDYLPQYNLEAKLVQDIYPMNYIISDQEMDTMLTPAGVFIDSDFKKVDEWITNKIYPAFVCDRLKYLPVDKESRSIKCKRLMYLHYLLHLYSLKPPALRKKDFMLSDIPPLVRKKLIGRFTVPVAGQKFSRSMPLKLKDSLLFHILVLCLTLDDFKLQASDLNVDLPGKDLLKYLRLLGCKVTMNRKDKSIKNDAKAVLTVPLTFPQISPTKGTKRK